MTIKEFCNKYGVDKNMAYNSTWMCKRLNPSVGRNFDYDEEELKACIHKTLLQRIEFHQSKADEANEILRKIIM